MSFFILLKYLDIVNTDVRHKNLQRFERLFKINLKME